MMHRPSYLMILLCLFGWLACETDTSSETATTNDAATTEIVETPVEAPLPESHDCQPQGEAMEENQLWLRAARTLVTIEADSTTADPSFGESHRIVRAYNTADCSMVFSKTLPVNESPDYAYYLATINYNRNSRLVAIQGKNQIYCYDVEQRKLLPKLVPTFKSGSMADASSGTITNLELYENYLLGYAVDLGFFAFDLRQKNNVQALPASASYDSEVGESALFFIESNQGDYQGLICHYDADAAFTIATLLSKPRKINTQISDNVANNRFIVLGETIEGQNQFIAIDMQIGKRVTLPD
ncbi:MAG: hypothetical protein AAFO94_16870, partial [Bacteroidota bacterium]